MDYHINLEPKYRPLEVIDMPAVVAGNAEKWFNQTLTEVNDSLVRLGVVEGEFHWHQHDTDDEFFFVLSGRLLIDLEDRTIELGPEQGTTIPRTVRHRPRALQKTVMLMVETHSIVPTGDRENQGSPGGL